MAYSEEKDTSTEKEDRVTEVNDRWKEAKDGHSDWRAEARLCFDFKAGHQWTQEDKAKLEEEGRPDVTFNRSEVMVESVAGLEINNRQSIRYFPREIGDVKPNEILTETADWARDNCDAEDEESEAFKDATTCGVGCTETRMDYEEDEDGKLIDERRDPLMMFPDPASTKRGYKDARYVFHAEWMDKKDIEARWPDVDIAWSDDDTGDQSPGDGDQSYKYDGDVIDVDVQKDRALVKHYQCFKRECYYRLFDPFQKKNVTLPEEDFEKLKKNGEKVGMTFAKADKAKEDDIAYVKQFKKVYYRGFYCGKTELEFSRSPIQGGFTFKFITAKRDRNKKCWYGVMRSLIDPQKWANKWLSQGLHILNSNTKGGAFVEEGALVDKRKAEEQWSTPAPLILLTEGSIEKVKERTPAPYPAGFDRLMMFAFESMPFVTGINLEALGLANREQAGVLEAQRKKAAMAILAPLFASLREFRKEKGRLYLEYIEKFIPEGKIIRVVGEKGVKYVKFTKSEDVHKHDVVIDESPDSPDFREKAWAGLEQLLPALAKQGVPIPADVLKYAPIPSEVAESLEQAMAGKLPPQAEAKMQEMQQVIQKQGQELQKVGQENQQLKQDISVDMAKTQQKAVADDKKLEQKEREAFLEAALERQRIQMEASMERFKAMMEQQTAVMVANIQAAASVKAAKEKPRPTKQ